jgi:hypothetical protein
MKKNAAPIIAAFLLLLPVLYVGSYLALVTPGGVPIDIVTGSERFPAVLRDEKYYLFDRQAKWFFWPLEQIDRKVRPGAWRYNDPEPRRSR